jgi:hypothetical protein
MIKDSLSIGADVILRNENMGAPLEDLDFRGMWFEKVA